MKAYNTLPDGPQTPRLLRRIKLITRPLDYLEDYAKVYGDCFTFWSRSGVPLVYFSHPQALQEIFTADSSQIEVGRGNRGLGFLLGDNSLILLDGDRHQRQRQLLTPPFHGDRMRTYGQTICEIAQQVSNEWKIGQPFNIRSSMQEITLRVILRVVFGLDEGPLFQQLRQKLSSMLDLMSSPLNSASFFFPFLQRDLGAWSPWGRILGLKRQVEELIYTLIRERRAESNPNRQDILSLMMSARDVEGQPMTDAELHDELMTLLVAGHETTASALTWAFHWVDRLPEVRDKLLKELDSQGETPDPTAIARLPYLTAVCQETLRIYPIVINAFFRMVKSPMEIMGYKLEPGAIIIPSIYLTHHREDLYPQPKQFRPERFLERQFSQYEYLPFGGGNRLCIGIAFAQFEMKLVLATILSRLQLKLVNNRPVRPVRRGLTVATPPGLRMVATSQRQGAKIPVGSNLA